MNKPIIEITASPNETPKSLKNRKTDSLLSPPQRSLLELSVNCRRIIKINSGMNDVAKSPNCTKLGRSGWRLEDITIPVHEFFGVVQVKIYRIKAEIKRSLCFQ